MANRPTYPGSKNRTADNIGEAAPPNAPSWELKGEGLDFNAIMESGYADQLYEPAPESLGYGEPYGGDYEAENCGLPVRGRKGDIRADQDRREWRANLRGITRMRSDRITNPQGTTATTPTKKRSR